MRTIRMILFFGLLCSLGTGNCQQLSPFVVSTSGGFYSNAEGMLSFTTGEMSAIETYSNQYNILTQGFQQAWDFSTSVKDPVIPGFSFSIYPNPSAGNFELITKSDNNASVSIEVYDVIGRRMFQKVVYQETSFMVTPLDLLQAPEGTFLVFLTITEYTSNITSQVVEKIQIIR